MKPPHQNPAAAEVGTQSAQSGPETFVRRARIGLGVTLFGLLVFLIGLRPGWFGLIHRPGIGPVKITVILIGLAIICLGGYLCMAAIWRNATRSILADIGLRLVSTGYVIAFFSAMADVFRIGGHTPVIGYFGPIQALGVETGEAVMAVGFLMIFPYRRSKQ